MLFVIGDSQTHAAGYMIYKNKEDKLELEKACKDKLIKLGLSYNHNIVYALTQICLILQYCDGGAYTTFAVTRDRQSSADKQTFYSNYNENFSRSFLQSDMGDIIPKAEYEEENEEKEY